MKAFVCIKTSLENMNTSMFMVCTHSNECLAGRDGLLCG